MLLIHFDLSAGRCTVAFVMLIGNLNVHVPHGMLGLLGVAEDGLSFQRFENNLEIELDTVNTGLAHVSPELTTGPAKCGTQRSCVSDPEHPAEVGTAGESSLSLARASN